ncbi:hypothetical protein GCM10007377_16270 [Galliscardovia ingluviei]|uniref:Uncharacterized protein n=1 Tax=Galliscardovia ingluviei TaxID=1769422 RepID=A0A8J3ARD8_9BIFI|nr:hypothetical protein [Galliscardovia ingluviei]GGI15512.1 hypothetical protein GCM10007377_16270 [Galliscardovia ingluviei]
MADNRDTRQILQDIENEQRTTSNAAQWSAAMGTINVAQQAKTNRINQQQLHEQRKTNKLLKEANRLHEQTLEEQQHTNAILEDMSGDISTIRNEVAQGTQELKKANNQLTQLTAASAEISRQLNIQNGLIAEVGDEVHQARVDQAYQFFAQWRQTPDGRVYTEWADRAQAWLERPTALLQRIIAAREKDAYAYAVAQLEKHRGEFGEDSIRYKQYPAKPLPPAPSQKYNRREDNLQKFGITVAILFLIGVIVYCIVGLRTIYQDYFGKPQGIFDTISLGIAFIIMIAIVSPFIIGAVWGIKKIIPQIGKTSKREAEREDAANAVAYQKILQQYQQTLADIDEKNRQIRAHYYSVVFPERRQRIMQKAWDTVMNKPLVWCTIDIEDTVLTIQQLVDNALFRPPAVNKLPELPDFSVRDDIVFPRTFSLNVREEIARICIEEAERRDSEQV